MKVFKIFTAEAVRILQRGGIGVIPTDTIYGVVGSALSRKTVARIYRLRHRRPDKPMIILIGSVADLRIFGIRPDMKTKVLLKKLWPGKVSVILQMANSKVQIVKFKYLHRGTKTLAFRLPKPYWLRKLLAKIGPLVAPSANLEGQPPAKTIKEAQRYFGDKVDPVRSRAPRGARSTAFGRAASNGVDFYVDKGKLVSQASAVIKISGKKILLLRKGATNLSSLIRAN